MNRTEQAEDISELIAKAEQGVAIAQFNLGIRYHNGRSVTKDDDQAIQWFTKAANQGCVEAQYNLGYIYREDQNYQRAIYWYNKAAEQNLADALCDIGVMHIYGYGVKQDYQRAIDWFRKAAELDLPRAHYCLGLAYAKGHGVSIDNEKAKELFKLAAKDLELSFNVLEQLDKLERRQLSPEITTIRKNLLAILKADNSAEARLTMTHYTSLAVGQALLLDKSPLRLGHINAVNDPNEGKLLWTLLGQQSVEGKPVFIGCFLPDPDSLNMWRFYSKNHQNDDACGCAITYQVEDFFDYRLLKNDSTSIDTPMLEGRLAFANSGRFPQESAAFYRVLYLKEDGQIVGDDDGSLMKILNQLKNAVADFLTSAPEDKKYPQLAQLLGPLPFLLKDADYRAEQEHRLIVSHLDYGAKEICCEAPDFATGKAPRLYLELHRDNHLKPIQQVTLGPKAPHKEMLAPYWQHQLAKEFGDQLEETHALPIRPSRCAYK